MHRRQARSSCGPRPDGSLKEEPGVVVVGGVYSSDKLLRLTAIKSGDARLL